MFKSKLQLNQNWCSPGWWLSVMIPLPNFFCSYIAWHWLTGMGCLLTCPSFKIRGEHLDGTKYISALPAPAIFFLYPVWGAACYAFFALIQFTRNLITTKGFVMQLFQRGTQVQVFTGISTGSSVEFYPLNIDWYQ